MIRCQLCLKLRSQTLRDCGPAMSPFAARDLLLGFESLAARVSRQCQSALALAKWLEQHPDIAWVSCEWRATQIHSLFPATTDSPSTSLFADPGLASHPTHATAVRYMPRGFGGLVIFALRTSPHGLSVTDQAESFMHALKLCYYAANLGDSRTLVLRPWTSTQSQLSEQAKADNGTKIETIRVSLGLEDVEDVKKGQF